MPEEEPRPPSRQQIPDDHYPEAEIEQALADLHRAMEALEMATWWLEGLVNHHEDQVTRKLRRDIRTLRTVITERSKGNTTLSGYGYDYDRYLQLLRDTPNTGHE
jgi:uncharacterized protein YPO0396